MSLIAVTGGTGILGQNLVSAALARGDEVRILSRRACAAVADGASLAVADVLTGQGLDRALDGAKVVIHAATSPLRWARATEIEGTRRVVEAAEKAAAHLIYVSIVGVDRDRFPYYRAKLAAEQIVAAARTTWAIARATQFHQLLDRVLGAAVFPVTRTCDSNRSTPPSSRSGFAIWPSRDLPSAPRTSVARRSCPSVSCDPSGSRHEAGQHSRFLSQLSASLPTTIVVCTWLRTTAMGL